MCILAERPFLISVLLSVEVDDRVFAGFASERQLVDETGLALGDARTLLRFKGLFFGLGITRYLRSARKEDVPPDGERTWILHEMLELTRMLSFPGGAPQDLHDRTIGDLTFTTTRRMATDRVNDAFPDLGADPVAPQSLGFLIMDMIWFLVGGSALVVYMDALRSRSSSRPAATPFEWIKRIPKKAFAKLESEPELAQAFEIAYILTHPAGRFGIDGSPRDAYSYADLHLRKLWPKFFLEGPARGASAQQPRGRDASSISTRSSATEMADPASYVEIEGDVFRWIIARYRRDRDGESDSACRVRIFKSRHGERVRFVVCDLAKDPHSTLSFEALTENLTLVPLYAFEERPAEFSVKLQPTSGTTKDCSIPYVFTFQSRDHVQLLQEALTGRTIQADAVLDTFSVVIKKHHGFEIRGFGIGFWNSRREEIQAANFGTMQIWRVLDQGQMDAIHQREEQQKRGVKIHPLRFEVVLTSANMLLIIGVRSLLRVRDVDHTGLSISSRDDARASTLIGRVFPARVVDGETTLPGLPMFQEPPFESRPDGEMIACSALRLSFGSKFARDHTRNFLVSTYHAKYL
ncbi:hypothetical protein PZA11_006643 [Diplocarpon coronariae]